MPGDGGKPSIGVRSEKHPNRLCVLQGQALLLHCMENHVGVLTHLLQGEDERVSEERNGRVKFTPVKARLFGLGTCVLVVQSWLMNMVNI